MFTEVFYRLVTEGIIDFLDEPSEMGDEYVPIHVKTDTDQWKSLCEELFPSEMFPDSHEKTLQLVALSLEAHLPKLLEGLAEDESLH